MNEVKLRYRRNKNRIEQIIGVKFFGTALKFQHFQYHDATSSFDDYLHFGGEL